MSQSNLDDFRALLLLMPLRTRKQGGPLLGRIAKIMGVSYEDTADLFEDRRTSKWLYLVESDRRRPGHFGQMTAKEVADTFGDKLSNHRLLIAFYRREADYRYRPRCGFYPDGMEQLKAKNPDHLTIRRVRVESGGSPPPALNDGSSKAQGPQQTRARGVAA